MKILLLDVHYGHSSTGRLMVNLKKYFEGEGHEVLACYGRSSGERLPGAIKVSSELEFYTHGILSRLSGLNGIFSPVATLKLTKIIDEFRPDVVHLHELHGFYINTSSVMDFLKRKKIPTVWTFHCEIMYTGNCGYALECNNWLDSCGNCPELYRYPKTWFFDFTKNMFNKKKLDFKDFHRLKIVAVSEWLAERVERSFLGTREIEVVHNGIDTLNAFSPKDTSELALSLGITTKHVIVSIAPDIMSESKGGKWVLEVAKRLLDQSITFVLVGVKEKLQNDQPNIIFLPATTNLNLLAQYYSLGDFFLLPSKQETFSLACAESLACGTPIIGFECGAPTKIIPPGYGRFVRYGDITALAELVESSLQSELDFVSSKKCVDYANAHFSSDVMGENYLNVFETLIRKVDEDLYLED